MFFAGTSSVGTIVLHIISSFVIVFPNGCTFYRGLNSIDCYLSIWEKRGCVQEGYRSPTNLSQAELEMYGFLTLRLVCLCFI